MGLFSKKNKDDKQTDVSHASGKKKMKDLYGAAESEKAGLAGKADARKSISAAACGAIIKPLVTEKVSGFSALNKYVFVAAKTANKTEVAKAVKEIYGIKPKRVNIIRMAGKKTRYGRISGKRKDWKKAIVTLPQGQSIKIYEGV